MSDIHTVVYNYYYDLCSKLNNNLGYGYKIGVNYNVNVNYLDCYMINDYNYIKIIIDKNSVKCVYNKIDSLKFDFMNISTFADMNAYDKIYTFISKFISDIK